ncbi:hypothetical protein [Streptomyces sp. CRN 30]|uniref:hypothetical protein n=1 Tax=Streptomyces sp. CRN 30 TaxID=3075613 RepID=UPI002A8144CF|nr:hypothetical protein [Streptomyces sp. CRN 30]
MAIESNFHSNITAVTSFSPGGAASALPPVGRASATTVAVAARAAAPAIVLLRLWDMWGPFFQSAMSLPCECHAHGKRRLLLQGD